MTEIWLSVLTVVVLLLLLRMVNKNGGSRPSEGKREQEKLHELIAEFEQENKELTRSITQMKRMIDLELNGMKQELVSLQKRMEELAGAHTDVMKRMAEREHTEGEALYGKNPSAHPLPYFLKDEYRDIPRLYAQGLDLPDIARKLGIGNGEVEMVIQLLKKQGMLSIK
ncbi:hypothetical protein JQN58_02235 [Aneurinibacillus sp. BA2021]|nr:hypothetical protein [Aneurinibacillus sp. BA2021]